MVYLDREQVKELLMQELELDQEIQKIADTLTQAGKKLMNVGESLQKPGNIEITGPFFLSSYEQGIVTPYNFAELAQELDFLKIAGMLRSLSEKKAQLHDIRQRLYSVRNP